MCGISGYIGKLRLGSDKINNTLSLMKNRGPDYQNYKQIKFNDKFITLLHSRLSIIDLDMRSNQPFCKNNHIIVFNGEIYNYIELRKKLETKGYQFHTNSDTEVLLTSYIEYGEKCVEYFEGMWSFVIYDPIKNYVFFSRDRFGEKPLYFYETNDGFYFGSEVKFIQSLLGKKININVNHCLRYLVNGHKSLYKTKDTFFNGVNELQFATNLMIKSDLSKKFINYWKPKYQPQDISLNNAIQKTRELLINSLDLRLRSDVPLAFCLSGGIDSASLVSIASKIFNYDVITYSIIDSDSRYNENYNINATIQDTKCKNIKVQLNPKVDNIDKLKNLIKYHDAPIATPAYFVHSLLSEKINSDGFKISISGTAADELYSGYYDHFNLHLYEVKNTPEYDIALSNWKKFNLKYVRNPFFKKPNLYFNNPNLRSHIYLNNDIFMSFINKDFCEEFTEHNYTQSLMRNRMLNELFHEVVRVILHEDDLNSMYNSIENRSPFLDTKLFDHAYSIPSKFLIQNGYSKYILRESVKGILNDTVRLTREKRGFNASIKSLIDFNNQEQLDLIFEDSPIYEFINVNKVKQLCDMKHIPNSYNKFLFNFINLKFFFESNC
jgi:asparagine synthase (glutamine-hydrolysing)